MGSIRWQRITVSRVRRRPPRCHGSKAEHYEQGSKSKQGHQPHYLGSVGRQQPFIETTTSREIVPNLRSATPMSRPRSRESIARLTVSGLVHADRCWAVPTRTERGLRYSARCVADARRGNSRFAWSHAGSAMDAQGVAFRRGQRLEEAVRETTSFGKRDGIGSRQSNRMGFRRLVSVCAR